jgi:hypothetical protein
LGHDARFDGCVQSRQWMHLEPRESVLFSLEILEVGTDSVC